jgi:alpha-L-fucosidase
VRTRSSRAESSCSWSLALSLALVASAACRSGGGTAEESAAHAEKNAVAESSSGARPGEANASASTTAVSATGAGSRGNAAGASAASPASSSSARDTRMDWWREARFGLFIHWGLYSIPAGEWKGRTDHAEWIRTTGQIPIDEYEKFLKQFNPVKFDADAWVTLAKNAGMKYIVITSKHHDGFCLFDSKYTDFDVMSTPFHRDILKELSEACRKQGMHMCFYHSIMDWHEPDYLPRRDWEKNRSSAGADFSRYVKHLNDQITELLTNYGPIGVLWFDGEWEPTWTNEFGRKLYDHCRELQPDVIVNNRVSTGRTGMAGMTKDASFPGDFGTPEQEIPAAGLPGVDWESCMTMNDNWGYNRADKHWKSTQTIVRMLCDVASKGGNLLLNIGPTSEGVFPPEAIERLKTIGEWMKVNGQAIHGTSASPFDALAWGRCTQKQHGAETTLYLHVFHWPSDGKLELPGLGNKISGAWLLDDPGHMLALKESPGHMIVRVPSQAPDSICSVVAVEIEGAPIVYSAPTIDAPTKIFVKEVDVTLAAKSKELGVRYTLDGSDPSEDSPEYTEPVRITKTTTLKARTFQGKKPVSATSSETFTKVVPDPAAKVDGLADGLSCEYAQGEWDKLPDFDALTKKTTSTAATITLGSRSKEERFGLRFRGYVVIPVDNAYTFALSSDDGSRLLVDGKLAIDNDGLHSSAEKRANLALAAGPHAIQVEYFNKTGQTELELRLALSGSTLVPVQASTLKHKP